MKATDLGIRLEWRKIDELIPYERNAKLHPQKQIDALARSFDEFGRIVPAGIDAEGHLIYGHGRIMAARERGDTDFPCIVIDHLSETQRRAFVHADNLLAATGIDEDTLRGELVMLRDAGFDISLTGFDPEGLKLDEADTETVRVSAYERRMRAAETAADEAAQEEAEDGLDEDDPEYQAFVDKFKPKKTSDDCYTPPVVYDAVAEFVAKTYGVSRERFVRPFYPGGDYTAVEYAPDAVVVDNPPFSILSEILGWYAERGIRFFLFAPTLTLFSSSSCAALPCGVAVTYENGANVSTSFLTNLEPETVRVRLMPELYQAVKAANDANLAELHKELPKYVYPDEVLTSAAAARLCKYGQALTLTVDATEHIRQLDAQKDSGAAIYGSGYLLSSHAAAERAAAERAAAERAAAEHWQLSERERAIISRLDEAEGAHG